MSEKVNCKYAFYKNGKKTLYCIKLVERDQSFPACAHQYFCNDIGKWANTEQAKKCPLKTGEKSTPF